MTRKSQRDESLEHLLRESLGTSSRTPAPGPCPDAETLAAWADGALAGRQLAAAQEHVADCAACQTTLAALARTAPPQAIPEPWWRRGLSARWLVPVAATATALAIWVAVPREQFMTTSEQARTSARETAAPQTEPGAAAGAAADQAAPSDARSSEGQLLEQRAASATASTDARQRAAARPIEQSTDELRREAAPKTAQADAVEERQDASPPVLQQPAAEPQLEAAAKPGPDTAGAREGETPAPPGRAAASAPEPAAPAPARAGRLGSLTESVTVVPRQMFARPIVVASPGTAFRWRLGAAGAVEYSADAGGRWEATSSGVTTDLTAGASPSGTVCWIVGRAGTVLLTTDGRQWRRLTFPVAVDLTAVQATDARIRHGHVRGRPAFSDGGRGRELAGALSLWALGFGALGFGLWALGL